MISNMQAKLLTLFLLVSSPENSFQFCPSNQSRNDIKTRSEASTAMKMKGEDSMSRRSILSAVLPAAVALTLNPGKSNARDELFKPNPLTNKVLEKIRILEQAEADNIQYGGELAPGSPIGRDQYAKLLVPIMIIQKEFDELDTLVHMPNGDGLAQADTILSKKQYEKLQFKKTFNAFADNIYYSDPDRANAYLGGGAVPKNEQSIAYLIRNDVLTNVENLQAEVTYAIKEIKAGNEMETEDLYLYVQICKDGMVKYLDLVPPGEVKIAKEIIASM
jgi:hypothetical protein